MVKGMEKVKWIKHMFRINGEIECINIEDLEFDMRLKQTVPYEICEYHKSIS